MKTDATDRRLFLATQSGLALTEQPYRAIAEQLGLSEEEVMARMRAMLGAGAVRRIGASINPQALGYLVSAMTVWDVEDERVDELGAAIAGLAYVSHCYRRARRLPEWPYNLYVKVHGRDRCDVQGRAEVVLAMLGGACRGWDLLFGGGVLKKGGARTNC